MAERVYHRRLLKWSAMKACTLTAVLFCALAGTPVFAAERPDDTELKLTGSRLWESSSAEVARMRKALAAHRRLLQRAEKTGLVVAIDAVRKDVEAARELLSLAESLLQELRVSLALDQEGAASTVIDDPLSYPQFREIRVLSDQVEQLYRSDRSFLERLQRPTETKVERLADVEPGDADEAADKPGTDTDSADKTTDDGRSDSPKN